ncbi:hypothetical protein DAKH74_047350 [Maudiozyma humilis]|uniref:Uncharacterized protein n=1 Tax=Maudiozyma humilis TaxID=51915 RepID=A0AAV5S2M3_MAUHU|nr:hypothetical protein DAKH74_047350 [Kazachstania humilis]
MVIRRCAAPRLGVVLVDELVEHALDVLLVEDALTQQHLDVVAGGRRHEPLLAELALEGLGVLAVGPARRGLLPVEHDVVLLELVDEVAAVLQLHVLQQVVLALVAREAPGAQEVALRGVREQVALEPGLALERLVAEVAAVDVQRHRDAAHAHGETHPHAAHAHAHAHVEADRHAAVHHADVAHAVGVEEGVALEHVWLGAEPRGLATRHNHVVGVVGVCVWVRVAVVVGAEHVDDVLAGDGGDARAGRVCRGGGVSGAAHRRARVLVLGVGVRHLVLGRVHERGGGGDAGTAAMAASGAAGGAGRGLAVHAHLVELGGRVARVGRNIIVGGGGGRVRALGRVRVLALAAPVVEEWRAAAVAIGSTGCWNAGGCGILLLGVWVGGGAGGGVGAAAESERDEAGAGAGTCTCTSARTHTASVAAVAGAVLVGDGAVGGARAVHGAHGAVLLDGERARLVDGGGVEQRGHAAGAAERGVAREVRVHVRLVDAGQRLLVLVVRALLLLLGRGLLSEAGYRAVVAGRGARGACSGGSGRRGGRSRGQRVQQRALVLLVGDDGQLLGHGGLRGAPVVHCDCGCGVRVRVWWRYRAVERRKTKDGGRWINGSRSAGDRQRDWKK